MPIFKTKQKAKADVEELLERGYEIKYSPDGKTFSMYLPGDAETKMRTSKLVAADKRLPGRRKKLATRYYEEEMQEQLEAELKKKIAGEKEAEEKKVKGKKKGKDETTKTTTTTKGEAPILFDYSQFTYKPTDLSSGTGEVNAFGLGKSPWDLGGGLLNLENVSREESGQLAEELEAEIEQSGGIDWWIPALGATAFTALALLRKKVPKPVTSLITKALPSGTRALLPRGMQTTSGLPAGWSFPKTNVAKALSSSKFAKKGTPWYEQFRGITQKNGGKLVPRK